MNLSKKEIEQLDTQFEKFIEQLITQDSESEFTPEKRRERRKQADENIFAFCRIYFPRIFDSPSNAVHRHIAQLEKGNYTVSGFRKSGKTAFTFISKIVYPIVSGQQGIYNVCLRTLDIAKERTFHIFRLITFNKLLMYDYDVKVYQELKGYYIINKAILVASSVETGLRNFIDDEFKRFRVSVNDDLYNRNTVDSERDNEKVTNFIKSEIYGQMEDDGLSITLGNSISADCPIMRLKKEFPENHFSLPALDENGHSTWPERFSDEYWRKKQKTIPLDVWMGEYMDKPVQIGNTFQKDWLRFIYVNTAQVLATITAIDPAYGESPTSCFKSAATLSAISTHEVVLEDIYIRREDYFLFFDYIDTLREKFPRWKVALFENDFNQWTFAQPYYRDWMTKRKKTIPIVLHHAKELATEFRGADKESRIMNLVHPHQTGMFLYSEVLRGSKDFDRYQMQYLSFGKAKEKLDGLDATATAYIQIFRYIETGTFKPLKQRIMDKINFFGF